MYTTMTLTRPVRSAGPRRDLSPFVCPNYGAYSPDLTRTIQLPPTLRALWVAFTDRPNEVIPYFALTQAFWPSACAEDPATVRLYTGRLRALLVQIGWPSGCLEVVWGSGVKFHSPKARGN